MLLENKNAVIYGGGGSIGGAVARAFAREGAKVFLAGRTLTKLDLVAEQIRSAGGVAETARVDAFDEPAVDRYADSIAEKAGDIDICFNAITYGDVQGTPLIQMSLDDFTRPITNAMRTQFLTTRAATRHMIKRGSGVVLYFGGSDNYPIPNLGGTLVTFDAIESLRRQWACELGPYGIRFVTLRTTGISDAIPDTGDVVADLGTGYGAGMTREDVIAEMREATMLKRLATLEDVGNVAVFAASDWARTVTGAAINMTCGAAVD
jgi:NAD(P)-dependent dehydrogenase (short-subunit alcohol dehydrogenase family)